MSKENEQMIGIVILNYENWQDTNRCIKSINRNPPRENFQIILVDNASKSVPKYNLEEFINTYHVIFIRNKKNFGYNAGNNVGIKKAQELGCSFILISNNDVLFKKNTIQVLCDFLKSNPEVGIVGPKIFDREGCVQKSNLCRKTGMKEKYLVRTRANIIFKKEYETYFGFDRNYDEIFQVYAVLGCCFMMSKSCADAVTPLDEYPFLYEEELILGIKMEQKNFVTIYNPNAVIEHLHGASTKSVKAFSFAHNVRSEIYYCRKYLNAGKISIYPLYWYRVCLYLGRCVKYSDFRKGWRFFRKLTKKELELI